MSSPSQYCAICGHRRRQQTAPVQLTHGITVELCQFHGAPAYLAREGGARFTRALEAAWRAHGVATQHRLAALRAHGRQQILPPHDLPGSYAWPELREEAERRYAAGELPADVIRDLRERYAASPARVPSARTMRRWFHEGRWRHPRAKPKRRDWRFERVLPAGMSEETAFGILTPLIFKDPPPRSEAAGVGRQRPRPDG